MSVLFCRVGEGATVLQVIILSVLAFVVTLIFILQITDVYVNMRKDGRWKWEIEEDVEQ